jgi:hypothetical protein
VGGNAVYGDRPCGADQRQVPIAADPNAPRRGNLAPGAKLILPTGVADACWDRIRLFARDPTTAKRLSEFGSVGDDGFPYVTINSVFTNRNGGPERRFIRCRLSESDLSLDQDALRVTEQEFFRSQMGL